MTRDELKVIIKECIIEENLISNLVDESVIISCPDILYNKEKFDNGEINLCFITGFSGSGKSTLGAYLAEIPNVEHCDLDLVVFNSRLSDEELYSMGNNVRSFFNGSGKKYRNGDKDNSNFLKYSKEITRDFINHAKHYSSINKLTKFIVEGVWIYINIDPKDLINYAVYIKGTSATTSLYRALKRDYQIDTDLGKPIEKKLSKVAKKIGKTTINIPEREAKLNKYIQLYRNKI